MSGRRASHRPSATRRRRRIPARAWAAAGLAVALAAPLAALEVPFLSGRVNDYANIIPDDREAAIAAKLEAFEGETGAQIAVLTIDSLEGDSLEDFSLRVAETWGLGRAEQDDGLLLLVAKNDRKMRIEVGYGLEGRLTDLQAGRILNNVLRPAFRQGDFGGGIEAGVDAILGTLSGEGEAIPEAAASPQQQIPLPLRIAFFLGFLAFISIFAVGAIFSKGCSSWFLWLFLVPFFAAFPAALLGPVGGLVCVLVWLIAFPIVKRFLAGSSGKRFLAAHPGFEKFATSGGRGGGWSSGGGGFSGGGGSFGGGGASGSW